VSKKYTFAVSIVLSVLFTFAFLFLTVEIPLRVGYLLKDYFPDLGFQTEAIKAFLNRVRLIGYLCLGTVIALIIIGFAVKGRLAFLGSLTLFLPTFGYFAHSMFFLAGIGILRVLWMTFFDITPELLKLGDIIYVPAIIIMYLFRPLGLDVRIPLSFLFMALGLLILFLGVSAWTFGKIAGKKIIDFWIYRYSRHPQYLGFILWSYGVMLLATFTPFPRGGYFPEPSFPWLISALIIICVGLMEETQMVERYNEYSKYRNNVPFMLPIPNALSNMITFPFRILTRKEFPENRRDVIYIFILYSAIFTGLSLLFLMLKVPLR